MEQSKIEEQLTQLSLRIAKIEQLMGIQTTAGKIAPAEAKPLPGVESKPVDSTTVPQKADLQSKPSVGSRALGAVAIFCFVIAGVYFVMLAIQSGWLTPGRQFGGLLLLGSALISASFRFRSRHGDYSGHLAGAGLAVLYLAIYAGEAVWHILSSGLVLSGLIGVSALGLFLFRVYSSGYFAAATCLGTYIIPLLLHDWTDRAGGTCYYLIWDFAFTFFAIQWKDRGLIALASYAAILGGMFLPLSTNQLALFQFLQFVVFLIATGYYSIKTKESLTSSEAWALVPGLLIFYGAEYSALMKFFPHTVNWFAIGFAAALFCIVQFLRTSLNQARLASDGAIAAVISLILFHAGYLELVPEEIKPWIGLLAILGFVGTRKSENVKSIPYSYMVLLFGIVLVETGKLIFEHEHHYTLLDGFLIPAAYGLGFLASTVQIGKESSFKDYRIVPLFLGNVLMLLALSSFRGLGISEVSLSYLISALWAGFAVALLLISSKVRDSLIARSSLVIFGLVGLKILVVDSSSQGLGFRVVIFLIIGAFFYIGGALYGKVIDNNKP